jgi:ring-1,2-phenylacetyl-CoA epoxidase subunit PaaE
MNAHVSVRRIPDPSEPVPAVAWPTIALLVGTATVLALSCWLALSGVWPLWAGVLPNAVCSYLMFTVAHDATHSATSNRRRLNMLVGWLSTPFFAPQASFPVLRFIHMQHHRFTNHEVGVDPDAYTMAGPIWQRPLRWTTIDLHYLWFYLRHIGSRPRREVTGLAAQWMVVLALAAWAVASGGLLELVVLVLIPQRLAILWLAYAFDYLPHHGLTAKPSENRFRTTRNRIGMEWLLNPLLLYQNYHLVHHLHPVVPFYRYLRVWRRNEDEYLEHDPALSTARGRPITVDEYRRMRELAQHDH